MITFDDVTITYADAPRPVLRNVRLQVDEGELCLVVGRTGSGKSTLLGAINGLVPHFTGGTLAGRVVVDGRDTATHPPRELADVVGVVGQDPLAGFVHRHRRGGARLRHGAARGAPGRDAQAGRGDAGSARSRRPAAPGAARAVRRAAAAGGYRRRADRASRGAGTRRAHLSARPHRGRGGAGRDHPAGTRSRGHRRARRAPPRARGAVRRPGDPPGRRRDGRRRRARGDVRDDHGGAAGVELGRLLHWQPLPLSVRDARRDARPLRDTIAARPVPAARAVPATGAPILRAHGVLVRYGEVIAVRGADLDLHPGQVTALMGRNGSGKSSLLWALQGSGPRQGGRVWVGGSDPKQLGAAAARRLVGLVPQTPSDLLYLGTVRAELEQADRESGLAHVTARELLDRLAPGIDDGMHPRDLSEGQRLSLVLAIQLRATPRVVLLDEPTRGLDYPAKQALIGIVDDLAAQGRTVVISTHDVEFVALSADRVIVMAEGEIVADGPTTDVIVASPAFAPQTAKILAPLPYLTVAQVREAIS